MEIQIRKFEEKDLPDAVAIWNQVVEDGVAFPQTEGLTLESGLTFFMEQSYTGIAVSQETGNPVWAGAVISATPAMRWIKTCAAITSVSSWCNTASIWQNSWDSGFCSLTRW